MLNNNKLIVILLVFIISIVTILRVVNLGGPSFAADEGFQFFAAKGILEEGKPTLPSGSNYGRALIYSKIVSFSMSLFGVKESAARLPSVLFGLLTVLLVYYWCKKYFSLKVGLIAAFLVGFSPVEIAWSRECRMYSAFQFFYLLGVFSFFSGFTGVVRGKFGNTKTRVTNLLSGICQNPSFSRNQIIWLSVSLVSFIISYKMHKLTGVFYFSIMGYFVIMFLLKSYSNNIKLVLQSRYFFFLLLIFLMTIFGILLFPHLLQSAKDMLQFSPAWARTQNTGPSFYYKYLFSLDFFPLGALFLIGTLQVITRFSKAGFYLTINFIIPIFMHSFIVKVKSPHYIFYVYPFLLIITAYAISNLLEIESKIVSASITKIKERTKINFKTIKIGLICALILITTTTFWFRDGIGLIFFKTGKSPALEHPAWREATSYLSENFKAGEVVVTTLPLNLLYYYGKADYQLNNGSMYYVKEYNKKNDDGFFLEPYSNTPVIKNLEQLKNVIKNHSHGWLIMDRGRFNNPANVSKEIHKYVKDNLIPHKNPGKNTMVIYEWRHG